MWLCRWHTHTHTHARAHTHTHTVHACTKRTHTHAGTCTPNRCFIMVWFECDLVWFYSSLVRMEWVCFWFVLVSFGVVWCDLYIFLVLIDVLWCDLRVNCIWMIWCDFIQVGLSWSGFIFVWFGDWTDRKPTIQIFSFICLLYGYCMLQCYMFIVCVSIICLMYVSVLCLSFCFSIDVCNIIHVRFVFPFIITITRSFLLHC